MGVRLVDGNWGQELQEALQVDSTVVRLISPFIKTGAIEQLLAGQPSRLQVITRFKLADFAEGVSDIRALRLLLRAGASIRGIRNLHSKLYLFGTRRAIVTSANLTAAALERNHEFGMVAEDNEVISACKSYFERLWAKGGADLTSRQLEAWHGTVAEYRTRWGNGSAAGLPDHGIDAGLNIHPTVPLSLSVAGASQAFVKFLGHSRDRKPLTHATIAEIQHSACHRSVAYPYRPTGVQDNALIFMGRLTTGPDIRIFGRAIATEYVAKRDDITVGDSQIASRWPHVIRVFRPEFVAGTMGNGISLNELMDTHDADSFVSTQEHMRQGKGNTSPRKACQKQAAIKLTRKSLSWLNERLETAFEIYGKIPRAELDELDPPGPFSNAANSED